MAIGIKVCKVCGKEYESCHTLRPNLNNEFRWQDVACSPEHGAEYLRQILLSRGELSGQDTAVNTNTDNAGTPADTAGQTRGKRRRRKNTDAPEDGDIK